MKKSYRPRSGVLTVVGAATALVLFGGGSAVAGSLITSARIKDNTIQSIDVHNGTLGGIDVRDGSLTGADVKAGSLTGSDVKDGSLTNQDVGVLFAQVNPDATLASSSGGVTTSQPFGAGTYQVTFSRDVSHCAFVGTVGEADAGSTEGIVATATDRSGVPNAVYLNTTDLAGTLANMPFQLVVVC